MDYIGLDIGTSGCKAAVVGNNGEFKCVAHRKYSWIHEKPGYVEIDPIEVWDCVKGVLKEIAPQSKGVKAMAVSSLGEAFVLLDSDDKPLRNSMVYLDNRGNEMLDYIEEKISIRDLQLITGARLNGLFSLPQLLWVRDNEPEVYSRACKFLLYSDYINYKLTGKNIIDTTLASRTLLYDIEKLEWSELLMDKFDLSVEMFSTVKYSGEIIGGLTKNNIENLGLSEDIVVYVGCHDQCAAMLGAGIHKHEQMMIGQGSTESMNVMIDKSYVSDKDALLDSQMVYGPYIIKNTYAMYAGILTSGTCIRWYIDVFEKDLKDRCIKNNIDPYEILEKNCVDNTSGTYFLPYLSDIHFRDDEQGALGAFVGLNVSVDKSVLYRALLEGMCFESRMNFERLRRMGIYPTEIVITGGCSKSKLLMEIKASTLNLPINILKTAEAGIIALSMICAVACNKCKDYEEATKKFVKMKSRYMPSRDMNKQYEEYTIMRKSVIQMHKMLNERNG